MSNHKYYDREDGLAHCMVCGGGEGSLPSECPGRRMTSDEDEAVYAGKLNFIRGRWWTAAQERERQSQKT